jgi:hypothetical protein
MNAGVSKSGSPAPKSMISRPDARRALALCETAIVADSLSWATFAEGMKAVAGVIGLWRSIFEWNPTETLRNPSRDAYGR